VSGPIPLSGRGGLDDVLGLLIQIAYVLTAFATIVSFVDYLVQFKNSTVKPSYALGPGWRAYFYGFE